MDAITELLKNPAAAALIAAALTFLGGIIINIINQRSLAKKEERQWNWSRQFEEEKLAREEKKYALREQRAEKEQVRNIYQHCIRLLATLASEDNEIQIDEKESLQLVTQAHEWLSLLALHLGDKDNSDRGRFYNHLDWFTREPYRAAGGLRDTIVELALYDTLLFPGVQPKPKPNPDDISVQVDLDDEFLRQQFVEGNRLDKHNHIKCDLSKLTPSQRQILWDMFGSRVKTNFLLKIPTYNEAQKKVLLTGKTWTAEFDPHSVSSEEVFSRWEVAYNEALAEAQRIENDT